jgi:hypothetical protein
MLPHRRPAKTERIRGYHKCVILNGRVYGLSVLFLCTLLAEVFSLFLLYRSGYRIIRIRKCYLRNMTILLWDSPILSKLDKHRLSHSLQQANIHITRVNDLTPHPRRTSCLRLSLNRSQYGGCSTKYDTSAFTQVVCMWFRHTHCTRHGPQQNRRTSFLDAHVVHGSSVCLIVGNNSSCKESPNQP